MSVGRRVNSSQATRFRIWANQRFIGYEVLSAGAPWEQGHR